MHKKMKQDKSDKENILDVAQNVNAVFKDEKEHNNQRWD